MTMKRTFSLISLLAIVSWLVTMMPAAAQGVTVQQLPPTPTPLYSGNVFWCGQGSNPGHTYSCTIDQINAYITGKSNSWVGKQFFAPSGSSAASINIPVGTTPSAPTNGDLWCTTIGCYIRSSGVTSSFGALFTPSQAGLVPPSGGTDPTKFLNQAGNFVTPAGAGTVTSVQASGGATGLTFSGGPITGSGTLTAAGVLNVAHGGIGITTTPPNGSLPIGNGSGYTNATLTAGAGIALTNSSGGITIAATGGSSSPTSVFDVVKTYGGNNINTADNTAAFNAAKAACAATLAGGIQGGGIIYFGAGTFLFTQNITDAAPGCFIQGAGFSATTLSFASISGDAITLTSSTAYGIGISDLRILNGGSWTSGFGLNMQSSYGLVENVWLDHTPQAVHHTGSVDVNFNHILINDAANSPVVLCDNAAGAVSGSRWRSVNVTYFGGNTTNTGFQQGAGCNSLELDSVDHIYGYSCLNVVNGAGIFTVTNDFECDHSQIGVTVDGGTGIQMTNSWLGSTLAGSGINFTNNFTGFATLNSMHVRGNSTWGLVDNSTTGTVQVNGGIWSANGLSAAFTGSISGTTLTVISGLSGTVAIGQAVGGVGVAANTLIVSGSGTSWVVNNSQTVGSEGLRTAVNGNIAIGVGVANVQITAPMMNVPSDPPVNYGVFIGTGANYYSVLSPMCGANVINCVADGSTGPKKIITGQVGP